MKFFKTKWGKKLSLLIMVMLIAGLITGCSSSKPTSKKVINIGYVNWAEDVAISHLWKEILQEKGYEVNLKSLDVAPLFVGLSKGNIDVFMDSWLPITHKTYLEKYREQVDDYGVWYIGEAKLGLVVPKYVDIKSIEELNANKAQFNGKIIGIDPGANYMKATAKAIEMYGLDYELVQSSEAAMLTALDKAYRDKKGIVITGWSPHWMFAKYDLKYLEDPKTMIGTAEKIHILANKKFTQNNPEIVQMLKAFKLDDKQIGSLESLIVNGMKPEDAAKQWIKDNRKLVDSWIK